MEKVAKVYFDPLLSEQDQIKPLVASLPIGSAHPYQGSPLIHTQPGIVDVVDISMHSEDYFSNSVSLGDLGRLSIFPFVYEGSTEELDMGVVKYVLHNSDIPVELPTQSVVTAKRDNVNPFDEFRESTAAGFLDRVEAATSIQDIGAILGVSPIPLQAFAEILESNLNLDRLPENFRGLVLSLLLDRSRNAEKVKPTKMLFKAGVIEAGLPRFD